MDVVNRTSGLNLEVTERYPLQDITPSCYSPEYVDPVLLHVAPLDPNSEEAITRMWNSYNEEFCSAPCLQHIASNQQIEQIHAQAEQQEYLWLKSGCEGFTREVIQDHTGSWVV